MFFNSIQINQAPQWFHCEPAWHWAPPPLADFDLWFVASGRGELRLEGQNFELHAGKCFVVRPDARPLGSHEPHDSLVIFACHFSPQWDLPSGEVEKQIWPDPMTVRDTAFFFASASRAEKLWRRGDAAGRLQARFCIENMLRQLADEALQNPPSPLDDATQAIVSTARGQD